MFYSNYLKKIFKIFNKKFQKFSYFDQKFIYIKYLLFKVLF